MRRQVNKGKKIFWVEVRFSTFVYDFEEAVFLSEDGINFPLFERKLIALVFDAKGDLTHGLRP
ncbi:hypothetical protein TDIS_1649 [Thermosulfurimonas dismutans]|uniref:Uncharacterized protein n=1 Tax=Thermosulfurimonas dismutans TaxID=999894 RepID=A0A179D2J2_9BACT|nr:hypothetical protein TDIS_1649 [Thermosulfurimonas dismutans]